MIFGNFARFIGLAAVIYFVAWTAWYMSVLGTDFGLYFEYLRLAWTGKGLEIPPLMQVAAVVTTALCLSLFYIVRWLWRRH